MRALVCIPIGCLLIVLLSHSVAAQSTRADRGVFAVGYHAIREGNTSILSVVGQNFAGVSRTSSTQIVSGFLTDTLTSGTIVSVAGDEGLPESYSLGQNYPNPFNPSTTIHFELPDVAHVTLIVYNVLGQQVMSVLDEERSAGRYDVRIDASALSSGAYFYRLQAEPPAAGPGHIGRPENFVQTRKFLLIR